MDELDKQIKKLPAELRVCIFEQLLIILTEQEEYSQVIEFLGESHPFSPVVVCQILKKCGKFSHLAIAAYANHHPLTQKMINIALSTSKCPSAIIENDTIVKQMDRTTILGIIHQYPLVALGKIEMTEEIPRILQRGTSEELANDIIKSIPTSSYKDNIYYI